VNAHLVLLHDADRGKQPEDDHCSDDDRCDDEGIHLQRVHYSQAFAVTAICARRGGSGPADGNQAARRVR